MGMENNPIKAIYSVDENKCVFVLIKKPLSKPEKLSEEDKKKKHVYYTHKIPLL